ncbi:hypothetical protein GQ54DRAFT_295021 [Martensiomyces pterosporus]|nr:hypothetical protein GQ54DRAFT_295021 [Martensiomyces pterosporus]
MLHALTPAFLLSLWLILSELLLIRCWAALSSAAFALSRTAASLSPRTPWAICRGKRSSAGGAGGLASRHADSQKVLGPQTAMCISNLKHPDVAIRHAFLAPRAAHTPAGKNITAINHASSSGFLSPLRQCQQVSFSAHSNSPLCHYFILACTPTSSRQ